MMRSSVRRFGFWLPALLLALATGVRSQAPPDQPGLLFYLSGDRSLEADVAAGGDPRPNFSADVEVIPNGAKGGALQCGHTQLLSYWAPGNIYAQRGTLAFSWRSREAVGPTAFPVFRVSYADHSSWDMVWLRIDYNGNSGFDAFVTDASLARQRVSITLPTFPKPDQWVHLALSWDETRGIRFYVDGKLASTVDGPTRLDAALDQFGPHSRIISPYQVQSAYNFVRGGDIDEVRIYDRMLSDDNVANLAKGDQPGTLPAIGRDVSTASWRDEWWYRYGWNRAGDAPPALDGANVTIRKVEIHDVYDLKRWWWKGTDGIRETTWPGVYNRSRLPGRNDYFQLPDWDVYSTGGKSVTFLMPKEPWNQIEVAGAAFGAFEQVEGLDAKAATPLFQRPKGQERTFHRLTTAVSGQALRFTNVEQETPIGELGAYYVTPAKEPRGVGRLTYRLTGLAELDQPNTGAVREFIDGRFAADERTTMVALPQGAPRRPRPASKAGSLPLVHIVIPGDLRDEVRSVSTSAPGRTRTIEQRPYAYGWMNMAGGLDGIAIDLPALKVKATHGDLFPLNIQVKDPIWPLRTMLDVNVSVKPGEPHTIYLDTRNRVLRADTPLYLTIAGAGADFGSASLEGAEVRLIFTSREQAVAEQSIDRFTQARDLFAHTVEERPNSRRLSLFTRFEGDLTDLFAVDPDHRLGREYWYETNREQPRPSVTLGTPAAGVPLWAFRQGEWQRATKRFVNYFIDHRQIENGEFGGGLSDDGDLTNWWPGTAFIGATPEKIKASLLRHMEAFYEQGMFTNGLATIQADELHSYEEGIQVLGQVLALDFGGPVHLERAMETARSLEKLTAVNAAGHRHIRSSYFSGTKIAEDGVWGWSKPSSYLILHPAIALVDYNGAPRVKKWLIELADGLLAHRKADANGALVLRTTIRFSDDTDIATPSSSERTWPLLWAAYRWTGDRKYVQPMLDAGPRGLGGIASNAIDILGLRKDWNDQIVKGAAASSDPTIKHLAWQLTGDTKILDALYTDQVEAASVRAFINSWGSVWTDRAAMNHAELQRARLGGVALVRNAYVPGHAISWWFAGTRDDERVAILVPDATPSHIRVVAYNMGATPILAKMTGWDVEPGTWTLKQATGANPDALPGTVAATNVALERSGEIEVTFAPGAYTVLELALTTKGTHYWTRPDLGIGTRDVVVAGRTVTTTVHSLGAVDSRGAKLVIADRYGKELGHGSIPSLKAPADLMPRKVLVKVTVPADASLAGGSVRIVAATGTPEVTLANNTVRLPDTIGAVVPATPAAAAASPLKSRDDPKLRDPKLPTLFVVGDSTVKNHGAGEGWGDHVAPFFDESRIQVLNWAMGGRSTRSFLEEGRWTRVLAQMKAGDFVLLQFGHNDQSEITMDRGTLTSLGSETEALLSDRDGTPAVVGSFGAYFRRYVTDARAKGATVILCTPVPRNWWLDDGRFNNVMAEHSALVRALGKELDVPVIDLNQSLSAKYVELGRRAVSSQWYTAGDNTHTNAAGAGVNAAAVAEGIKGLPIGLKAFAKP